MAASDRFTKLSEQLDQGQNDIEAAAVDDRAKRQARVDAARKRADDRRPDTSERA